MNSNPDGARLIEFEIDPKKPVHAVMGLSDFRVRSGSTALLVGGVHNSYERLRDELIAKGVLVPKSDDPNILEFIEILPLIRQNRRSYYCLHGLSLSCN